MSDINGFRAYESALIGGMLASGKHTADSVREQFSEIRRTARLFSGSVDFPLYPIGTHWMETDAAQQCLLGAIGEDMPLAEAMALLKAAGFDERVSRYTYRWLIHKSKLSLWEVDGVPMLSKTKGGAGL